LSLRFWIPTLFIIVVFGVTIPAMVIGDNREETGGGGGGGSAAATESGGGAAEEGGEAAEGGGGGGGGAATANAAGKQIFTQSCGTCHTLSDAGTSGRVGPVLDDVKPSEQQVVTAIEKGGLGTGSMPANIVTGKDAQDVAEYVAAVAGQ
jgi:mono/diheme cytochrome c family protein